MQKKILRNLFLKDVKVPVPILDIPKDIRLSVQKLTNILNDIKLGVKEEFIYLRRDIVKYYIDPLAVLRILADFSHIKDLDIYLDYAEIYDDINNNDFLPKIEPSILILTEGKTDTEILRKSLNRLFPYIEPYFNFMNMEDNSFGATSLVNFVKGLNSINYNNNVIAIFDNDVAGNEAKSKLPENLLKNIKIMTLPKHKKFNKFNTKGFVDNKIYKANINGSAVAIECFLDLPKDAFIRWKEYNEKLNRYQGKFDSSDKTRYQTRFRKEIEEQNTTYDFTMLEFLWNEIIKVAVELQEKKLYSDMELFVQENKEYFDD